MVGSSLLLLVNVVMLTSAGSTLDSTFSSIAKAIDRDARTFAGRIRQASTLAGRGVMVGGAVLGTVPLFLGARDPAGHHHQRDDGDRAGPVFVLGAVLHAPPASFHLAFWPGLGVGLAETLGLVPAALHLGDGDYAALLGANVYGLAGVTALFLLPVAVRAWSPAPRLPPRRPSPPRSV